MLRTNRIAMGAIAASAVMLPVAGFAAATAGPAGAAKTKTITCTKAKGTETGKIKFTGCSGNTGGATKKAPTSSLESGGTVKWANGKTTTFGAATLGSGLNCPVGDTDITATGTVSADTTGSAKPIPGVYNAEVCIDASGNITLPPGHPLTVN